MGIGTAAKAWLAGAVLFVSQFPLTADLVNTVSAAVANTLLFWTGSPDVISTFSAFLVAAAGAGLVYVKRNTPS